MNNDFLTIYLKGVEDGKDKKKREIDMLERKLYDLQQENEQLKEKIEKLKDYGEKVGNRRNELYERIDKAIEYIKENCTNYYVEKPNYRGVELINIEELLKILGDKE